MALFIGMSAETWWRLPQRTPKKTPARCGSKGRSGCRRTSLCRLCPAEASREPTGRSPAAKPLLSQRLVQWRGPSPSCGAAAPNRQTRAPPPRRFPSCAMPVRADSLRPSSSGPRAPPVPPPSPGAVRGRGPGNTHPKSHELAFMIRACQRLRHPPLVGSLGDRYLAHYGTAGSLWAGVSP